MIVKPYDAKSRGHSNRRGDFAGVFLTSDSLLVTYIRNLPKSGLLPSGILKITTDDSKNTPLPEDFSGEQLVHTYGCRSCHVIAQIGSSQGPSLDGLNERLFERIGSADYKEKLSKLEPASAELGELLSKILSDSTSKSSKIEAWITSKILNPKFDSEDNAMPNAWQSF